MTVAFITTCLVSLVAMVVWRIHPIIVAPCFLFFGLIDGLYLSSALTKVPHGAWFTILLAGVLTCIILLWRYGKNNQWKSESFDVVPAHKLVGIASDGSGKAFAKTPEGERELRSLKGAIPFTFFFFFSFAHLPLDNGC